MALTVWKRLRPVDIAVLIYNFTITLHILISAGKLPDWSSMLIIHGAIFGGIAWLATTDDNNSSPLVQWIKIVYPVTLLVWFYPEVGRSSSYRYPRESRFHAHVVGTLHLPE